MSKENLDKPKTSSEKDGAGSGELNDTDLDSVAGGLISVRSTPVPEDGRSIKRSPVPDDGRGITGLPVPDDGKLSIG